MPTSIYHENPSRRVRALAEMARENGLRMKGRMLDQFADELDLYEAVVRAIEEAERSGDFDRSSIEERIQHLDARGIEGGREVADTVSKWRQAMKEIPALSVGDTVQLKHYVEGEVAHPTTEVASIESGGSYWTKVVRFEDDSYIRRAPGSQSWGYVEGADVYPLSGLTVTNE